MYRVIGELLNAVLILSSLTGNPASSVPVFEPRDSKFRNEPAREIEMNVFDPPSNSTQTPLELLPPDTTMHALLCESCPFCYQCLKPWPQPKLPTFFMKDKDKLIFYSIDRSDKIQGGLRQFHKDFLKISMWSAGLVPLRVWVEGCTLIVSIFSGAFPVCNCDPAPHSYQIYGGGFLKLFSLRYLDWSSCREDKLICSVVIKPEAKTLGWLVKDNNMTRLLNKYCKDQLHVVLPSFSLSVFVSRVTHKHNDTPVDEQNSIPYVETFFALSREELSTLARDIIKHSGEGNPELNDLDHFIADKIKGNVVDCYEIGSRPQLNYSFRHFLDLDKVR